MPRGFAFSRGYRGESDLRPSLQRNNRELETHINSYIPSYEEDDGVTLILQGDLITGGDISIPTGAVVDGIDPSAHNHDGTGDNGMVVDHGNLVGKGDDDHSQYLDDARHVAKHQGTLVRRSSVFGIADSTLTEVPWNDEIFDDGNWHSNGTNPERITVSEGGWYSVCAGVDFGVSSGVKQVRIYVNGTSHSIQQSVGVRWLTCAYQLFMSANSYFTVQLWQTSGSTSNITADPRTYFSVVRFG